MGHVNGLSNQAFDPTRFSLIMNGPAHQRAKKVCELKRGEPSLSMEVSGDENSPLTEIKLRPVEATPETFADYGQVVESSNDGDEFGPRDAQLDLSRGVPRFYIMCLKDRELKFTTITHHASVTQCLGAIGGGIWYLGVARPSIVDVSEVGSMKQPVVKSHCGHLYVPPDVNEVRVFKVEGPKFLKLHRGTWHAGPLFLDEIMDFYNLELSNTNVVDHTTHDFRKENGVTFVIEE